MQYTTYTHTNAEQYVATACSVLRDWYGDDEAAIMGAIAEEAYLIADKRNENGLHDALMATMPDEWLESADWETKYQDLPEGAYFVEAICAGAQDWLATH